MTTDTRNRLATLVFHELGTTHVPQYRTQLTVLEAQVQQLEATLSAHSVPFRAQTQAVTLAAVQQGIPPNAALVEIAVYQPFVPTGQNLAPTFEPLHYVAYVLHREDSPAWVDLGEAAPIQATVEMLRSALQHVPQTAALEQHALSAWMPGFLRRFLGTTRITDVQELARQLDEQVMRPIRPLLGQSRLILLSPDGVLNLIPFGVLVDEQQRFLVERFTFAYLTTGRELLRFQTQRPPRQGPLILANPNFGPRSQASDEAPFFFDPLPGTAQEGQALHRLLPHAQLFSEDEATEAVIKRVQGPWLLHVATHAFFLADQPLDARPVRASTLISTGPASSLPKALAPKAPASAQPPSPQIIGPQGARALGAVQAFPNQAPILRQTNPLLRSGLALAGANLGQREQEDGILTALETTGLDLWGTQLVVLSACETGVGTVYNGEGVYGLRRALVMAGAETQVMSLWKVHDEATRELMVRYYQRLLAKQIGRAEALREVQLAMLKEPQWQHPFYWAAFILSGAWTPLTY